MGGRFVIALLGAICLWLAIPASASADTTCSYSVSTQTLTVGGDPIRGTKLSVDAFSEIRVQHLNAGGINNVVCAGPDPTTTNTELIDMTHPAGSQVIQIENIGAFAPGVTDEGGGPICADEIEIEMVVGIATLQLLETENVGSEIKLGGSGLDANAGQPALCQDMEVDTFSTPFYEIDLGPGTDSLSAEGGGVLGNPYFRPLVVDGGDGKDVLVGGEGDDWLTGGLGKDQLFGGVGLDGLFAEDGKKDKTLDCGEGDKLGEFAVVDKRKDPKAKSC